MTTTAHTPGDLKADLEDAPQYSRISILTQEDAPVAEVLNADDFPCNQDDPDKTDADARAFAARLVKAWNCHDELLAALLKAKHRYDTHMCYGGGSPDYLLKDDKRATEYAEIIAAITRFSTDIHKSGSQSACNARASLASQDTGDPSWLTQMYTENNLKQGRALGGCIKTRKAISISPTP